MDEANTHPHASTNAQDEQYTESAASSSVSASPSRYTNTRNHSRCRQDPTKASLTHRLPPTSRSSTFGRIFDDALRALVDNDDDLLVAETWSAPTHIGSECDDAGDCETWETLSPHAIPDIYISPPSPSLDGTAKGDYAEEAVEPLCEPCWTDGNEVMSLEEDLIPIDSESLDETYQRAPDDATLIEEDDVMSLDDWRTPGDHEMSEEKHDQRALSEDSRTLAETVCGSISGSETDANRWEHMSGTTCVYEANSSTQEPQVIGNRPATSITLYNPKARCPPQSGDAFGRRRKGSIYYASRTDENVFDIDFHRTMHHRLGGSQHGRRTCAIGQRECATICAFCGSIFSGPRHKVLTLDHIQLKHLLPSTDLRDNGLCKLQTRLCGNVGECSKPRAHQSACLTLDPGKVSTTWQDQLKYDLASDLKHVGTQWQDGTRVRRSVVESFTVAMAVAESSRSYRPDPKTLMDRINSLVNTSDDNIESERINDLFNGLEVVAQDLAHRHPQNDVSHVIRHIISSVERKPENSKVHASAAAHVVATTSTGTKTCPASAGTDSPNQSNFPTVGNNGQPTAAVGGSDRSSTTREPDIGNDQRQDLEVSTSDSRAKDTRSRRLGCPFQKNAEVNNEVHSCRFKGGGAMSAVKAHLIDRDHRRDVPFIDYCGNCSSYIIDALEWRDRHRNELCTMKKQSKGGLAIVRQWRELFVELIPGSNRVPHPYVGNSTWIPKVHPPRQDENMLSITQGEMAFDFNSSSTAPFHRPYATPTFPRQATTTWPSSHVSDSGGQTTTMRDILFEPPHSIAPYQPIASHLNTATYEQAFLDDPEFTASRHPFRAVSVHSRISSTNIATPAVSNLLSQDNESHVTGDNTWSNARVGPSSTEDLLQNQVIDTLPRDLGDDRLRIAALQTVCDLLEAIIRRDSISTSARLADRIANVNGLSSDECDTMSTDLLSRMLSMAEQLRPQAVPFNFGIESHTNMPGPQVEESPHVHYSTHLPGMEQNQNPPPIDPWEDLFTPATLDHPTWHSEEFLARLAARSLDEFTLPAYVPT